MVNVPPIPPLLCSTPPPIDFGDEDEDVDVLPPTLDGIPDEEYGDYLAVDDSKSIESLPSPRPQSVTDLPPMSIYDDGSVTPNETYTNHVKQTSPEHEVAATVISQETTSNGTLSNQNTPIIEAFNYSIINQVKENLEDYTEAESKQVFNGTGTSPNEQEITLHHDCKDQEAKVQDNLKCDNDQTVNVLSEHKQQENQSQAIPRENNLDFVKHNISPLANIVSIEDLEDDLSEDELYSPKTPKNFAEIQDMNNFFAIHEIKHDAATCEVLKTTQEETSITLNANKAKENNLELDKSNAFADFASPVYAGQSYDLPPPLEDEFNNLSADDNDDFGDFADFQDFSPTTSQTESPKTHSNNLVPVNEKTVKQFEKVLNNDVNNFEQDSHVDKKSNINSNKAENCETFNTAQQQTESHIENEKFAQLASQASSLNDFNTNVSVHKESEENSHNNEDYVSYSENNLNTKESQENVNESVGEFNEITMPQKEGYENTENEEKQQLKYTNNQEVNNVNDDDDFGDFADFEQHQVTPPQKENEVKTLEVAKEISKSIETHFNDEDDDDDDDFGDFNTAQPLAAAATSTATTIQPSQPVLKQLPSAAAISLQTPVNLNERISKILQFMFMSSDSPPSTPTEESSDAPKTDKIQDIPFTSIDAAKALEYQWLSSETRHSFIKSLGIDSRNILYGENWNPSLPRFAANLSFNPLKPMKPVTSNSSGADTTIHSSSCPTLEPVCVNSKSEYNKPTPLTNNLGTTRDTNVELDWNSSSAVAAAIEQTREAFKDNTLAADVPIPTTTTTSTTAPLASSVPYLATEPSSIVTHTIFENPLDADEKFSKTPPISEMESVNTFTLPISNPITSLDIELPSTATQILNDYSRNIELNELEDLSGDDTLEVVVASTTFAGSFKETHIYTPPKTVENSSSSTSSTSTTSPSKAASIDFDYEKAAMGVIIDETVVKKEYRDIEYNSPFTNESLMKQPSLSLASSTATVNVANTFALNMQQTSSPKNVLSPDEDEFNDEFSDFQSVPSEPINTAQVINTTLKSNLSSSTSNPSPVVSDIVKPANVSACGMILSPAILIPQAISMESQKPKIEWGDSTTSINPEELARIEELFPEPKSVKSNNSNSSQKSTPTHQANHILVTTPSISAAVANKEMEGNNDDDDWSDFVSVPVTNNNKMITNNNLAAAKSPSNSPFKHRSPANAHKMPQQHYNNSNNDDEWSDFVSSVPTSVGAHHHATTNQQQHQQQQSAAFRSMPQFNSGAWQNANFYNNPLSLYHKGPLNLNSAANQHNAPPKNYINNNNNNYTQYNQFQMSGPQQQHQHQQQIHIMQNFSTAPVPTAERHASVSSVKNNQFQVGSAKVAPSIALIPDLGFVAPAIPTHTSFINSLPKPSINTKK